MSKLRGTRGLTVGIVCCAVLTSSFLSGCSQENVKTGSELCVSAASAAADGYANATNPVAQHIADVGVDGALAAAGAVADAFSDNGTRKEVAQIRDDIAKLKARRQKLLRRSRIWGRRAVVL